MFEAINGLNITMSFGVISFSANVRPNGFIFNTYHINSIFLSRNRLKIILTLAKKTAEKSWIATEKKFNGNVVLGSCLVPFYPHGG